MGATVVGTAGTKDGMDVVLKCGAHQVPVLPNSIFTNITILQHYSCEKLILPKLYEYLKVYLHNSTDCVVLQKIGLILSENCVVRTTLSDVVRNNFHLY
jgi:hypothetical protein